MRARRVLAYAWAAPNTLLGCAVGLGIILCGGTARLREGAIEFGGGALGRWASRLPASCAFSAMTLGHVIIGIDDRVLAGCRAHEQVHVRQYERWGPLFLPAYLLSSLVQLLLGRRPYRDNRFEREAYDEADRCVATAGSCPRR